MSAGIVGFLIGLYFGGALGIMTMCVVAYSAQDKDDD